MKAASSNHDVYNMDKGMNIFLKRYGTNLLSVEVLVLDPIICNSRAILKKKETQIKRNPTLGIKLYKA